MEIDYEVVGFVYTLIAAPSAIVSTIEYYARLDTFNDLIKRDNTGPRWSRVSEEDKYEAAKRVKTGGWFIPGAILWPITAVILLIAAIRKFFSKTSAVNAVIHAHEAALLEKQQEAMRKEIERQRKKVRDDAARQRDYEKMSWDQVFDDLSRQIGAK
jgi:hypothetical protein